ncbi:MAG TPA: DNA-directed RNA polymerase subunit RpoH/Rpb5 C-terminal domain-containing protein [Candidatus Nanoarchaeia archaeon]|nr:DNA-directed RNA polymerase subunit RpoH/Rpb5 C-terminal domain-containing protein [Candidatus Nanoarchaeia archaeon]
MHILQPKHIKLKQNEVQELIKKHNISLAQLPKIKADDPSLPEGLSQGDVVKIERKDEEGATVYYRAVV